MNGTARATQWGSIFSRVVTLVQSSDLRAVQVGDADTAIEEPDHAAKTAARIVEIAMAQETLLSRMPVGDGAVEDDSNTYSDGQTDSSAVRAQNRVYD